MTNKGIFKSALILVARESLATVDKQALRACGVRDFQILSSGVEAALVLASAKRPDMTLCADTLADMTGDDFVRLVRLHPALVPYPVIVAVTMATKDTVDKARAAGYSGLLQRPYTHGTLGEQLERARLCRDATAAALAERDTSDTSAFMAALAKYQEAFNPEEEAVAQKLRHGLLSVRQQRWVEGIGELEDVLRRDGTQVEAMLGLSAAWRAKGNETKSRAFLRDAVAVLADKREWDKAQTLAARLVRDAPDLPNPLFEEAARLITTGEVQELSTALEAGLALNHAVYPVEMLSRACATNVCPESARELLLNLCTQCGATSLNEELRMHSAAELESPLPSQPSTPSRDFQASAATSRGVGVGGEAIPLPLESKKKFFGRKKKKKNGKSDDLSEPEESFLGRAFPALNDALMVAKVTLSLFRHMK